MKEAPTTKTGTKKKRPSKEELKGKLKAETFDKQMKFLLEELAQPQYQNQTFEKGAMVSIPGELFVAVINEWHRITVFQQDLKTLLTVNVGNTLDSSLTIGDQLSFMIMKEWKRVVDEGQTKQMEPNPAAEGQLESLEVRFKRRVDSLMYSGVDQKGGMFEIKGGQITDNELYEMSEERFQKIYAENFKPAFEHEEVKTEA